MFIRFTDGTERKINWTRWPSTWKYWRGDIDVYEDEVKTLQLDPNDPRVVEIQSHGNVLWVMHSHSEWIDGRRIGCGADRLLISRSKVVSLEPG
jgi:hypothetical protein